MLKDLVVHLDGSAADTVTLAHAEALAARFEAHLVGLYTNIFQTRFMPADLGGGTSADIIADLLAQARQLGDESEHRLRERFANLGVASDLRRSDGSEGDLVQAIAHAARGHDLFVALRPYGVDGNRWPELVEAALFAGGRGVYLVPPEMAKPGKLETVLIAWRDTFESTRAIAEAMPFLKRAATVVLAAVADTEETGGEPGEGVEEMARHLKRHGLAVEHRCVRREGRISDVILKECGATGAGPSGHGRLRPYPAARMDPRRHHPKHPGPGPASGLDGSLNPGEAAAHQPCCK
ncbi:universal stress protein [Consotaella aegiceratis]|uniref:universal stress protein n=1 Tax=Consotaella aegiceratis TaxID=3097961 RepID=UPI002F3F5870